MKPRLISGPEEFQRLIGRLRKVDRLAVDTESNSFHAYRPRICLIQLSTEEDDYIVDPLALEDLEPLGEIFQEPAIEKILHACENDLTALYCDFRFSFRTIFDTAVAYRLLGHRRVGLATILAEELGVTTNKNLQRYNWEKRPLTGEQLAYAQLDTHFLIELRQRLHRRLLERDLWEAARRRFSHLEKTRPRPPKPWNPEGYLRLKGADTLPPASLRALRGLYAYRENLARKTNRAPFRIMTNEVLLRLARALPRDRAGLNAMHGLPSRFKGKAAEELLRVLGKC